MCSDRGKSDLESWFKSIGDAYFRSIEAELTPTAGVIEMLDHLDALYCVASNSPRDRLNTMLKITGLADRFESRVFSAEGNDRKKPAPDLFLRVASIMGVPPKGCLVIEDSMTGLVAAKAAGMRSLAYLGGTHLSATRKLATGRIASHGFLNDWSDIRTFLPVEL